MSDIESLPLEIFIEILRKTDGITLGKCRRVCKNWKVVLDSTDYLWEKVCQSEFKYASLIARRKAGKDLRWYHIYKNLVAWPDFKKYKRELKQFYVFLHHDTNHALDIEYGVLPLRETRGVILYDANNLKLIPVVVPDQNVLKIANNDIATVILLTTGLLIQKTVENSTYMSEAFFKADLFVLDTNAVYFCNEQDVYMCDLKPKTLSGKLIAHIEYNILEMQYNDDSIYIFTRCGKILTITRDHKIHMKPINCPPEWIVQIKYVSLVNALNFVCYYKSLFKIETEVSQHLYLDFPLVTSLFFYIDFALVGTWQGEILMYRLSSQQQGMKPKFMKIAQLPNMKYPIHLDVCERESGPVIIAATYVDIMVLELTFFPHEVEERRPYPPHQLTMFKRLLTLKDRLRMGVPSLKAIS